MFAAYDSQRVSGVRFFFGLDMPGWSTPIDQNNQVKASWAANVNLFFQDMAANGIPLAVPTPSFLEAPLDGSVGSDCRGETVSHSRVAPFGFGPPDPQTGGRGPIEGFGVNECYNAAPQNTRFVGWRVIAGPNGVIDHLLAQASIRGINVYVFDMENEVNIHGWTVMARLIYDNAHGMEPGQAGSTDVLSLVRSTMQSRGFDPLKVVYSAAQVNPDWAYPDLTAPPLPDVDLGAPYAYSAHILNQNNMFAWPFPSYGYLYPDALLTRGEAAVLLIRSIYGGSDGFQAQSADFTDVPADHPYKRWIDKMRELGITVGCATNQYCPDRIITNGEMAVFAVRAWQILKRGTVNYYFYYPYEQQYYDISWDHPYYTYIQKVRHLEMFGATGPNCSQGNFCANFSLARGNSTRYIAAGPFGKVSGTPFFCYTVYGDSGRTVAMSAVDAAITGQLIGSASNEMTRHYQNCGGSRNALIPMPGFHGRPTAIDIHSRPCLLLGDENHPEQPCKAEVSGSENIVGVRPESEQTFRDIYDYLADRYGPPSPIWTTYVHIGESWETLDTCGGIIPQAAATKLINGYNASKLAGKAIVLFNHWGNHTPGIPSCSPPLAFTVRPPYDPSSY